MTTMNWSISFDFETDFPLLFLPAAPPVIAFSVALMDEATTPGDYGPFAYRTILPYRKVFANVGNGYNPTTGRCAHSRVRSKCASKRKCMCVCF